MQEAHCLLHSKSSLCWGGVPFERKGTPSSLRWGRYPREPPPDLGWSTPISRMGWGTPHLDLGCGTLPPHQQNGIPPCLDLGWGTPIQTWDGVPPTPGMGYPHVWTWDGVPPPTQTWDEVPPTQSWDRVPLPPPHKCEQTETITFPHPSDAGGENMITKSVRSYLRNIEWILTKDYAGVDFLFVFCFVFVFVCFGLFRLYHKQTLKSNKKWVFCLREGFW